MAQPGPQPNFQIISQSLASLSQQTAHVANMPAVNMAGLGAQLTRIENRLTAMDNRFNQELRGVEARIRREIMYSEHKSIVRNTNSLITTTTANLSLMNLPGGDEPHALFPRTRRDINNLTSRQIRTLSNAYDMNIRNALPLEEKWQSLCRFIGVSR